MINEVNPDAPDVRTTKIISIIDQPKLIEKIDRGISKIP